MNFRCPGCEVELKAKAEHAGKRFRCPKCKRAVTVPAAEQTGAREAISADETGPAGAASAGVVASGLKMSEDDVPEVWSPGDVILDLYEVKDIIGEGGFGTVYKVHHRGWNTDLAVKSPREGLFQTERQKKQFVAECETWVNLGLHPHTVSCYYVRTLGGIPRVFAEYVEGGSLKGWIAEAKTQNLQTALDIAIQIAWGMSFAHENGLIHRDLKPANVLLTLDGTAKVTDFGLARHGVSVGEAGDAAPAPGVLVSTGSGTPGYGAPEQWSAGQQVDHRTDIFAFGVTLWRILGGRITWADEARKSVIARHAVATLLKRGEPERLPQQVADLILRCLEPEPEDRWPDSTALVGLLKEIYAELTGEAYARAEPRPAELSADTLNNRALSLSDLGRFEEAERIWDEAQRVDSGHVESVYNCGLLQWRKGQIDDLTLKKRLGTVGAGAEPWRAAVLSAQVELERDDCESAIRVLEGLGQSDGERSEVQWLIDRARTRLPTSRRCLNTPSHRASGIWVSLSADGRYCLSAVKETLELWELRTGECLRTFEGHEDWVRSVSLSADDRYCLSGSRDKTLRLWEVSTGKCLRTFEGHTDPVTSVCLSQDGGYALSGSRDKTLKLWEVGSGRCLRTFEGHNWSVHSVSLSNDGRYCVSGGASGW